MSIYNKNKQLYLKNSYFSPISQQSICHISQIYPKSVNVQNRLLFSSLHPHTFKISQKYINNSQINNKYIEKVINKQMQSSTLKNQQPKSTINVQSQKNVCIQPILVQQQKCYDKYCKKLKNIKLDILIQITTSCLYILVAFGIFCVFERTTHISLHQQTYFSEQQVVYPSEIRGLFPPIQGLKTKLYGKWKVCYTNSLTLSSNNIFNNYTIQFKNNNYLRIKRIGCDGDYIMNWQLYQYNIHISNYTNQQSDKQFIIQPDINDTQCIINNSTFLQELAYVSVWTIYDDNLYLLVEKIVGKTNVQSILLLAK